MRTRPYDIVRSTDDVVTTADRLGSPFFSRDSMRFHHSRVLSAFGPVERHPAGRETGYILTSDRNPFHPGARRYFVRRYIIDRDVAGWDSITFETILDFTNAHVATSAVHKLATAEREGINELRRVLAELPRDDGTITTIRYIDEVFIDDEELSA